MKNLWDAILKDMLPTVRLRLIAGAIPTLTASVFALPVILQNSGVFLSPQTTQFLRTIAPLIVLSTGLIVLLIYIVYHNRTSRLTSEQFTEHKGAFFKHKPDGDYHEAVYCGICKSPTSTGSTHVDSYYKCKCGWVSNFTYGNFKHIFKELSP